jgi:tetratricopeptide (TPR) repeat protein
MKILKVCWGIILLAALVAVVQLADPPTDSPAAKFQRLPDVSLKSMTEAEWAAGRTDAALLLLDHIIENDLPEKAQAVEARREIFAKLASENTPMNRLKATGWAAAMGGGNAFESLAGSTVADAALYGEIAELARQGGLEGNQDEFMAALNSIRGIATVFPPAEGAITLAKAARSGGALNEPLTKQLRQMLGLMQSDPKSALAVEKFKENFMPMFELAKRCRTWGEFQVILQQADSPDQMKVLTKMASASPDAAKRLSQVLAVAARGERATALQCLDHILRQGPKGLDALHAAIGKGAAGLKFVVDHPSATPQDLTRAAKTHQSPLDSLQDRYQSLRYQYGAAASALKYLVIAVLCGLLVLTVVPGRYLEKLVARPGSLIAAPGPAHYFFVALAVGAVLSGLAYLLSMAARPAAEPSAVTATIGENAAPVVGERGGGSAFLTGTVVLLSLAIHAVVWFYARGKIRQVEDDEAAAPALRLKRLENLDIFLDLPLFTGLALTVVAFILITLNAGMSRHFAYTSTVVGILSSVSLRIRYQYPLKERLIQMK